MFGANAATDAGTRGAGAVVAAAVTVAAAAAHAVRSGGTAVPPVRAKVLRAPVQQPWPVRAGRRLRDRRRVRVPFPGGRKRATATRPHRPSEERLSGRTVEHNR